MQFEVHLGQLHDFANRFWDLAGDARVFAFHGAMGAGKTTMISALCQYKGSGDVMASPTFSIINEYAYSENGQQKSIYHIDLYRLRDEEEVIQAGVEDCIYSGSLCFVEWPGKAPGLFDENTVHVSIDVISETERKVEVKLPLRGR